MAVHTAHAAPLSPSLPQAAGPSCSLQRSGSLWQLGIEAQELTAAIGLLAQRLESDEPDDRQQALVELEATLLAEEGNKAALAAKADATCWVIEHLRDVGVFQLLDRLGQALPQLATELVAGEHGCTGIAALAYQHHACCKGIGLHPAHAVGKFGAHRPSARDC